MATFFAALEKQLVGLVIDNVPLAILLIIAVIALAATIAVRYNKKISAAEADRQKHTVCKKQQEKILQLLENAPCISKRNATWLQDETKNGGRPPEPINCQCRCSATKERG
jgi:hypothetical protein